MEFIDFCCGIGGLTTGLEAAGHNCILGIDNDSHVSEFHQVQKASNFQSADLCKLDPENLPEADFWVAGFPCQPYSSSGNKKGNLHKSGHVFAGLLRLIFERRPTFLLFENVVGLLRNKSGSTMASILFDLTKLGYEVSWQIIDLALFGVPQSRPRLFIFASLSGKFSYEHVTSVRYDLFDEELLRKTHFAELQSKLNMQIVNQKHHNIEEEANKRAPSIGKSEVPYSDLFGQAGFASGDNFTSYKCSQINYEIDNGSLGNIVAPKFTYKDRIRSGRYYARGKPTELFSRKNALAHCMGTSIGGAPLFVVNKAFILSRTDKENLLQYSNWHKEYEERIAFRLIPEKAVELFGPMTEPIIDGLRKCRISSTNKYKLVGNLVAPICAKNLGFMANSNKNVCRY